MKERFEHAFVEQHVTHRLGDNDVNQLRQINLLNLARDHADTIGQKIVLYKSLETRGKKSLQPHKSGNVCSLGLEQLTRNYLENNCSFQP